MHKSTLLTLSLALCVSLTMTSPSDAKPLKGPAAQSKAAGAPSQSRTQPKLPANAQNKAVNQFRQVRNKLATAEKFASQKHTNAKRTLERTRETERALKDIHATAMANAIRNIPKSAGTVIERQELARKNPSVKQARRPLRTATTQRANAEMTVNATRSALTEAKRQTSAANRTLSLAKQGDWINAHRIVGRAKPQTPKTKPRKISFATTPLDATPNGTGRTRGILKRSSRNR